MLKQLRQSIKKKSNQTKVNILVLPSINIVSKYEFLMYEGILPKKKLLEKAVTIKRLEYLPFGSELKKPIENLGSYGISLGFYTG